MRIRFLAAALLSATMISAAALAVAMTVPATAATRSGSAVRPAPAQSPTTVAPSDVANKGDVHDATLDGVIGIIEGSVAILMAGTALIILFLRRPGKRSAG